MDGGKGEGKEREKEREKGDGKERGKEEGEMLEVLRVRSRKAGGTDGGKGERK